MHAQPRPRVMAAAIGVNALVALGVGVALANQRAPAEFALGRGFPRPDLVATLGDGWYPMEQYGRALISFFLWRAC